MAAMAAAREAAVAAVAVVLPAMEATTAAATPTVQALTKVPASSQATCRLQLGRAMMEAAALPTADREKAAAVLMADATVAVQATAEATPERLGEEAPVELPRTEAQAAMELLAVAAASALRD